MSADDADCRNVPLAGERRWADLAKEVPHQSQQILISWVFILASITLFLDFVALQNLLNGEAPPNQSYFAKLGNWFGVVSCILWLTGFAILTHWLKRIGATPMGVFGCQLKLLASVFFNLQPMTGTAGTRLGAGIWWSNLVGIIFFHSGNLVSCLDFFLHTPPGADAKKGWLFYGNLPITGMWVYQIATWFLVVGNLISCAWNGDETGTAQWVPTTHTGVVVCQYAGSLLLLLGSLIYGVWCNAFATCAL